MKNNKASCLAAYPSPLASRPVARFLSMSAFLFLLVASLSGQSLYMVNKEQLYLQTSASSPSPFANLPYHFGGRAASAATLTPPSLAGLSMVFSSDNSDYEVKGFFLTKGALDAAFPNGSYNISGSGFPTITINLSGDLYPTVIPQVIGGTWSNGALVVNPGQSYTITFNNFTGYASTGVGGHMKASISSVTAGDNVNVSQEIISQAAFGLTVSATPFTSYVIPANTLKAGLVYRLAVNFDTALVLNTTTISGSGIVGMYSAATVAYIAGQSATSIAPPIIATQPMNQTAAQGTSAVLSAGVTFNGSSSPPNSNTTYQWIFNGQQVGGGTKYNQAGGSLTINNVSASDVGVYSLEVYNGGGVAFSQTATLTVTAPVGTPQFTTQPQSQSVNPGANVTFTAVANGSPAPTFQWQYNGTNIAGATSATYAVTNVQSGNMGFYSVAASNSAGTVNSAVAILTVNGGHSRLTGLSTRGYVLAGGSLTPGFYLRGSGSKSIIVRAVGPSLSNYGVSSPLSDPRMDLIPAGGTTPLLSNDDWGTNTNLPALSAAMPFPLVAGSKDAAALITLSTATNSGYTVRIVPSGTATAGIAMAEVYDLDATTAPVQLFSLSTLGYTGPGENVLTPGFFITGNGPKQLLIRAVGPTLGVAPYNVPGVLADPQFRVVPLGTDLTVASNDNWGGTPELQAAFVQTNDFALPAGSKDAAAIVRLPPGGYTIQASGVGGTTGNVLVEVYDMDP